MAELASHSETTVTDCRSTSPARLTSLAALLLTTWTAWTSAVHTHPQAPGYANMTPAVTGEMQRLRVAQANQAHSIILQTIGLADIKTTVRRTFACQQALDMWLHLIAAYDAPLLTSEQDAIRIKMLSLSIACNIGYDTDTIQRFAARLQVLNGKLDPAGQLDQTGLAEHVLTATAIINA
eukprot:scaffold13891_cov125-Isochrysis_galbana.AAC.4